MGHPSPVSRRSAPVRLASSSGTCCFQASTASTANSGSVCSQARMASAKPWATKNCADSAAHAMSMAASRIDGAVQRKDDGGNSRIGMTARIRRAQTGAATCRGLAETDVMALRDDRVFLERRLFFGIVGAKVRAAALFARERTAGDQQCDGVDVAEAELGQAGIGVAFLAVGFENTAGFIELFAGADDAALFPG